VSGPDRRAAGWDIRGVVRVGEVIEVEDGPPARPRRNPQMSQSLLARCVLLTLTVTFIPSLGNSSGGIR
jgi:hypothetical protein